jgi:hypothetical protein
MIKSGGLDGWGISHAWNSRKMHAKFWPENVKGKDNLKGKGMNWRIILKSVLNKYYGRVWTGFIWLRIGISGDTAMKLCVQ